MNNSILEQLKPGLWAPKPKIITEVMDRMLTLAEKKISTPEEVFRAIEETLASETPTVLKAATTALKKLRKLDKKLSITDPERIIALIKRDKQRFEKLLSPLLS